MAKDVSADLMQALAAKLYGMITGDNEDIKNPGSKFVRCFLASFSRQTKKKLYPEFDLLLRD